MHMKKKAIAVVLYQITASRFSQQCITALRNQTRKLDAILVVNNGSTDNTEQWLQEQPDVFFITQKNVVNQRRFQYRNNMGIQTWLFLDWCMDDDGYPKEDAFENLLLHDKHERCLLNCAVLNKNDKKTFVWKTDKYKTINEVDKDIIPGIGHPFNGTLLTVQL